MPDHEDGATGHVSRAEFQLAKELYAERHGTLMLRLDALDASMRAQKELQDMVNTALREEMHSVTKRLDLQTMVLLLLVAVNLPGLWLLLTKGAH